MSTCLVIQYNTYMPFAAKIYSMGTFSILRRLKCAACQHQSVAKTTAPWHCRATSCRVRTVPVATRALVTWWLYQSTRPCHLYTIASPIHMTTALASLMDDE